MSAAKTTAERQREFRARQAEQQATEVRGIFAQSDDHGEVKETAAKIARRRTRLAKHEQPNPLERRVRQHTPGPWEYCYSWVQAVDGKRPIANFNFVAATEADACLIAAAPELLTALQMLYDETVDYIRLNNLGGMDNQCMQLARAALARAVCAA